MELSKGHTSKVSHCDDVGSSKQRYYHRTSHCTSSRLDGTGRGALCRRLACFLVPWPRGNLAATRAVLRRLALRAEQKLPAKLGWATLTVQASITGGRRVTGKGGSTHGERGAEREVERRAGDVRCRNPVHSLEKLPLRRGGGAVPGAECTVRCGGAHTATPLRMGKWVDTGTTQHRQHLGGRSGVGVVGHTITLPSCSS